MLDTDKSVPQTPSYGLRTGPAKFIENTSNSPVFVRNNKKALQAIGIWIDSLACVTRGDKLLNILPICWAPKSVVYYFH